MGVEKHGFKLLCEANPVNLKTQKNPEQVSVSAPLPPAAAQSPISPSSHSK